MSSMSRAGSLTCTMLMPATLSQRVLPLAVWPRPGNEHDDQQCQSHARQPGAEALPEAGRNLDHAPAGGQPQGGSEQLPFEEVEGIAVLAIGQGDGRGRDHQQPDRQEERRHANQHGVRPVLTGHGELPGAHASPPSAVRARTAAVNAAPRAA